MTAADVLIETMCMHDPVRQTGHWLQSIMQGHFNYYAVPGNLDSLAVFRERLLGLWWRRLRRRSQPEPKGSVLLEPHAEVGWSMAS
jgi:hypothetical protein